MVQDIFSNGVQFFRTIAFILFPQPFQPYFRQPGAVIGGILHFHIVDCFLFVKQKFPALLLVPLRKYAFYLNLPKSLQPHHPANALTAFLDFKFTGIRIKGIIISVRKPYSIIHNGDILHICFPVLKQSQLPFPFDNNFYPPICNLGIFYALD